MLLCGAPLPIWLAAPCSCWNNFQSKEVSDPSTVVENWKTVDSNNLRKNWCYLSKPKQMTSQGPNALFPFCRFTTMLFSAEIPWWQLSLERAGTPRQQAIQKVTLSLRSDQGMNPLPPTTNLLPEPMPMAGMKFVQTDLTGEGDHVG